MILGFNKRFPDKILSREKKHTIREDKHNRWRESMIIHFATGVRTKAYNCFAKGICNGVQTIEIKYKNEMCVWPTIIIDGSTFNVGDKEQWEIMRTLAKNDGFDSFYDFCIWFNKDFTGKIIHWTKLRY